MPSNPKKSTTHPGKVVLREVHPNDLPVLFAFESVPAWCTMAMVKPRTNTKFESVWAKIFEDWDNGLTNVFQKTIVVDNEVCGTIGCRLLGDRHEIGYGLGQAFWGRGIASRALGLLLDQVPMRPLYATAASTNAASIRVLEKHGFVIESRRTSPETERNLPCEEVVMVLNKRQS